MKIFGNYQQQETLKTILNESKSEVIAIVGPSNIGKYSFIVDELQHRIHDSDLFIADITIDSAREASTLFSTSSIYSSFRALVINDADNLSEPAQDAYLKLFEEPYDNLKIILICSDDFWLLDPLRSRITHRIVWGSLSRQEINDFINTENLSTKELAIQICNGRPGLYHEIVSDKSYVEIYEMMCAMINGSINPITTIIPDMIKNMSDKSIVEKSIIMQICSLAIRNSSKQCSNPDLILNFLSFVSLLRKVPAINAEIHWQKACCPAF